MRDTRDPENVLNSLSEHSGNLNCKFERLYRALSDVKMFYVAYQNTHNRTGSMMVGVDGKAIDGVSTDRVERLIDSLKNETYQPNPSKRTYISRKSGKKRPLGTSSFNDKMAQEVVRIILETIYEGSFGHTSHGLYPKRSCHTAPIDIQKIFIAMRWLVEGDIKGSFDSINYNVLINTLREYIIDGRFLRLIRKLLNAGYVADWVFHRAYSRTPQGGTISPILANIYLDESDKYIKEYINRSSKEVTRRDDARYKFYKRRGYRLAKKLKNEKDVKVGELMTTEIKRL